MQILVSLIRRDSLYPTGKMDLNDFIDVSTFTLFKIIFETELKIVTIMINFRL